jgi:hypothetical protein
MKLFDACVYTIVDEDDLLRADRGREPSDPLSEGKPWSKVASWLAEAKDRDERVAIVFADTKHVHRWLGWAVLTDDLSIDLPGQRQRATRYRFQNLRPLLGHPRSEFVLLQTGDPLPASHIRPYVHFRTPEFLRREAEQENGLLLSEWRQQLEVVTQARDGGFTLSGQRPLEEADPGVPPRTTMRSSVDRSDAEVAWRIFRQLYPNEAMLRMAAMTLADGVAVAHTAGSGSWSVTLVERMVRLNVGQVEVCTLGREGVDGGEFP